MHSRYSKQANDITLIENDVVITDKKELAELFNNYFVHIVDDVQDIKEHNFGNEFSAHPSIRAIAQENRRKNAVHNFNFKYTNKTQVEKLLSNINARKACGHDTITPRLLKESASAISGPLAELMNESIKQCKYPSRWKMGQVTPLFKKNDELSKENYRPVTVFSPLGAPVWSKNKMGGRGRVPRAPALDIHPQNKSTTVSVSIASLIVVK